jgi:L-ascorbate metabolism protein UlaG (beta-lactamase superfamily)
LSAPAFTPGPQLVLCDVGDGWFFESAPNLDDAGDAAFVRDRIDHASGGDARTVIVPVAQAAAAPALYAALERIAELAKILAERTASPMATDIEERADAALRAARGEVRS